MIRGIDYDVFIIWNEWKNDCSQNMIHLQIFEVSKTPAGLYARQKWRREEGSDEWRRDFDATVKGLRAGQFSNGSWNNSVITTIRRLFGLHLTVREPDEAIRKGLELVT